MAINTDLFDFADQLQRLLDQTPGMTMEIMAEKMGEPTQQIRNYLQLRKLHPVLKKLVQEDKIPRAFAMQIAYKPSERQMAKAKATFSHLDMTWPVDSVHQLSLYVTKDKGKVLTGLIELIGQPISVKTDTNYSYNEYVGSTVAEVIGGTFTWQLEDANQLVRAMGYANRLGLLSGLPNTVRTDAGRVV